ncbi:solute carrier family 22 member 24-like isoform X2 [Limulus polyphemus]|uniref:Solute carrier family 22 member 24-like isoform X2 n=1 Tax=Limulus polyphemus TaxID=6850 RepID=A0ABM1SRW3_LIMPO|nr:solute carrier family 22 member 24-like isoform X2 [Limulus polyphemus]
MASEEALRQAGEFGRFQYLIVAFLGLVTAPFIALVVFGHIFTLLEPPHWCHVPQLDALNLTVEQKKTLSIPKTELDGIIQFSKCQAYEVNFTHIFLDHNGSVPKPAQWWPVADCKHGWDYDYSLIYPTVVSEMNWVCEESWKMLMCHTVFWATSAVGVIVWGTISDMYGRIPVLVITSGIAGGAGIATMFFTEFIPFLIIRSVMGFVFLSLSITSFVLVIEYVVTSKRLTASSVFQFMYPVAASVIPWVAYYLKSWRKLSLIVSVPAFTIPVFCWFMPESLRWLVSKGKDEKAKVIIARIAHINGKHLPENYIETLKLIDISDVNKKKITIMDLLKTSNLRKNFLLTLVVWIICSTLYVGGQMYAATVMDNPFIMTSITCFVDVLATGISVPLADKWGRRPSMVAMFGMSSIAYFMISFVSSGYLWEVLASSGIFVAGFCKCIFYVHVTRDTQQRLTRKSRRWGKLRSEPEFVL